MQRVAAVVRRNRSIHRVYHSPRTERSSVDRVDRSLSLHLTGKGAAVLACEFVRVVDEGTGTIYYLN